jgi:hypothetical protein
MTSAKNRNQSSSEVGDVSLGSIKVLQPLTEQVDEDVRKVGLGVSFGLCVAAGLVIATALGFTYSSRHKTMELAGLIVLTIPALGPILGAALWLIPLSWIKKGWRLPVRLAVSTTGIAIVYLICAYVMW